MKFLGSFAEKGRINIKTLMASLEALPKLTKSNNKTRKVTECGTIRINAYSFRIFARDNFTCYLCGSRGVLLKTHKLEQGHLTIRCHTNDSWLTVDHWLPKSAGGNNRMDNLKTCCQRCNVKRGNIMTLEEFEVMRKFGLKKLVAKNTIPSIRINVAEYL